MTALLLHPIDPRIGVLIRNGVQVFYAFHQGYAAETIEGANGQPAQGITFTAVTV
ncbi:TPA: hypothetical protein ACLEB8_004829 [Pseudomonas aeruginosa]